MLGRKWREIIEFPWHGTGRAWSPVPPGDSINEYAAKGAPSNINISFFSGPMEILVLNRIKLAPITIPSIYRDIVLFREKCYFIIFYEKYYFLILRN